MRRSRGVACVAAFLVALASSQPSIADVAPYDDAEAVAGTSENPAGTSQVDARADAVAATGGFDLAAEAADALPLGYCCLIAYSPAARAAASGEVVRTIDVPSAGNYRLKVTYDIEALTISSELEEPHLRPHRVADAIIAGYVLTTFSPCPPFNLCENDVEATMAECESSQCPKPAPDVPSTVVLQPVLRFPSFGQVEVRAGAYVAVVAAGSGRAEGSVRGRVASIELIAL